MGPAYPFIDGRMSS